MSQHLFKLVLQRSGDMPREFYGQIRNWRDFFPVIRLNTRYRTRWPVFTYEEVKFTKAAKTYIDENRAIYGAMCDMAVNIALWNSATSSWDSYINGKLAFDRYTRRSVETLVGIDPIDFVMNVLNNDELNLELTTRTDINGNAITAFSSETHDIILSGQTLPQVFDAENTGWFNNYTQSFVVVTIVRRYWQIGFDQTNINELSEESFAVANGVVPVADDVVPFKEFIRNETEQHHTFTIDYDIDYDLTITNTSATPDIELKLRFLFYDHTISSNVAYDAESITVSANTLAGNLTGTYELELDVVNGDDSDPALYSNLKLFLSVIATEGGNYDVDYDITVNSLHLREVKDSEYETTTVIGMPIWEATLRSLQKITGRNDCLRSTLLGRIDSPVKTYGSDGDFSLVLYTQGRLVRQFPIDEYPLKAEFYELFKAINAERNIGVGIIYEEGTPYVVIEDIEYFWDNTNVAFSITDPSDLEESTALDYLFNALKFGPDKYRTEENGTLGSPHTPRVYTPGWPKPVTKNEYDFSQPAITSSPLIELLRRDPYNANHIKDNQHDDAMVLIKLKRIGYPGYLVAETGADFTTVSNLDHGSTFYNLSLTPRRALQRHLNWIKGGAIQYHENGAALTIRFISGEGNTTVVTEKTGDPSGGYTENENVSYDEGDDPLFIPNRITFKHPLTNDQMISLKNNPNQVVQVTHEGRTFKAFVEVDIEDFDSKLAKFNLLEAYE